MGLVIVIEPHGTYAIYEQIVNQIKNQIISGELQPDEALPSIRGLAADIGVSVITTKHAYEELEREGFIETVMGKGSFVAGRNMELIREEQLRLAEGYLAQAMEVARQGGIQREELHRMLDLLYEEEECWNKH